MLQWWLGCAFSSQKVLSYSCKARIGWFSLLNYWGGAYVYFQREPLVADQGAQSNFVTLGSTLLKPNMAPEKKPSPQKEANIPTIHFHLPTISFMLVQSESANTDGLMGCWETPSIRGTPVASRSSTEAGVRPTNPSHSLKKRRRRHPAVMVTVKSQVSGIQYPRISTRSNMCLNYS